MKINDIVLCVGVGKAEQQRREVFIAHLLHLDDLTGAQTRLWLSGEQFMAGKWYKKDKSGNYEQIGDVVPTVVMQKIEINNAEKKTILELVLPVFFPPDLANLNPYAYYQIPALHHQNALSIPICPLFGQHGTKCLPPVGWGKEQIGQYSDRLYALKINLSYTINSLPEWTHLNSSQLSPWNYEESSIVKQLCLKSRTEGLLLDGICGLANAENFKLSFMLNKQAEFAIAVFPEKNEPKSFEYREFWPINISIYGCPITIALDCPQTGRNFGGNFFVLSKIKANKFEITFKAAMENLTKIKYPWLGRIQDPFYLLDAQAKSETLTKIQATVSCHLEKRSVAWIVMAIVGEDLLASSRIGEMNLSDQLAKLRIPSLTERNDYHYILAREDRVQSLTNMDAKSYTSLVETSTVLADKSRFIYDILETELARTNTLLFALPSGSGKTTLLTMLRDFVTDQGPIPGRIFDQQFEKNKKIAIMREQYEDFRKLHYGKYPTLFIDLDMDGPKNDSEVEAKINQLISGLFGNEFKYLEDWLDSKAREKPNRYNNMNLRTFQEFADEKKVKPELWKKALDFLTKNMVECSKESGGSKRPIIIVDNCDGPIVKFKFISASSESTKRELLKIIATVQKFMECLSLVKENRLMVACGNYQFGMETLYGKKITMEMDLLAIRSFETNIMANFGFNEIEFSELCKAYRFHPNKMADAKAYFNGIMFGETPTYSTKSTMAMLNNPSDSPADLFRVYCDESPFFQHFHPLFKKEAIAKKVEEMFREEAKIGATNNQIFKSSELIELHSYVNSADNSPKQPVDLFVRFLIATGYVTRQGNLLVIPNQEKMTMMKDLMTKQYYEQKYKFAIGYANMITDELARIAMGEVKDGDQLKVALFEMLGQMTEGEKNEPFLQAVVGFAALRVRYWTKIALDKVMGGKGPNSLARPDVAFSSRTKKFALCAELKWNRNETVEGAYQQMLDCGYLTECKSLIPGQLDVAIALAIVGKPHGGKGADQIDICIEKFVNEAKQSPIEFLTKCAEKLADKYQKKT